MNDVDASDLRNKRPPLISSPGDCVASHVNLRRQKRYLLDELISSEIKYICYLKKILKYFAEPLGNSVLLPSDMHAEIFGRLTPILCVNETLLESVLTMGIEEAFLIIAPCLKLYADYARRYQTILVLLETCMTFNTELSQFIYGQENLPEVSLQLPALLIMPIQRIPRYSLLLQELLAIYLQLDGVPSTQAHQSVNEVIAISQEPHAVPEQVSAWILMRYNNPATEQPWSTYTSIPAHVSVDWNGVDQFASRASLPTVRLMAAFAGITATATYLNEQIRLNDQADMAALLQSKLLGRWTRNLLLVPGRRLLRYGLVYKINELSGRRQPRLFVLLSDILIYATPQKRHQLRPIVFGTLTQRKRARSTPKTTPRKQQRKTPQSLRTVGTARNILFHRRLKHGFTYPPFERAWLDSVARPHATHLNECPIDLLASKNVRFTCISVYPLHHCQVTPHFTMTCRSTDSVERSCSHLMFIDDRPVGRSPECRTQLTVSLNVDEAETNGDSLAEPNRARNSICPATPMSLDLGCLSQERNAFTISCRDVSFTVDVDDHSTAESWVLGLEAAINAVQMARQSLRKASSAKRPMPVTDFVSYEQWLRKTDQLSCVVAHQHPIQQPSRSRALAESLGLHEQDHGSGRGLLNGFRRLTSPFSPFCDSGKAYMDGHKHCMLRSSFSCLRSKSCTSLKYCVSKDTDTESYSQPSNKNCVQLIGVRAKPEHTAVPHSPWSSNSYISFDDCSPTFGSLFPPVVEDSPQRSLPSPSVMGSSGIVSNSVTGSVAYASFVGSDVSSHPVVGDSRKSRGSSTPTRCSLM